MNEFQLIAAEIEMLTNMQIDDPVPGMYLLLKDVALFYNSLSFYKEGQLAPELDAAVARIATLTETM